MLRVTTYLILDRLASVSALDALATPQFGCHGLTSYTGELVKSLESGNLSLGIVHKCCWSPSPEASVRSRDEQNG